MSDLFIRTRAVEPQTDFFREGLETIMASDKRKWLSIYTPEVAVERYHERKRASRCSHCSESPCACDYLDAVDRGEIDEDDAP